MASIGWRRFLSMCHLLGACVLSPMTLAQSSFPTKPIVVVVPYPAGGTTDALARALVADARNSLGQPIVVENRAGAGGNIGAEYVARADPDGYTLLFGAAPQLAINSSLQRNPRYDGIKSFSPVILVGALPNALVANPKLPVHDLKSLVDYAKSHPGKLSFGSTGNGAPSHLAGVLFNNAAGTDLLHVPYKGGAPMVTDMVGGQVDLSFMDLMTALPFIQSGKLRALAVTSAKRSQALPGLPSIHEQGLQDFDVSGFFGVVAPAGTPPERIQLIHRALSRTLNTDGLRATFGRQGFEFATQDGPDALARVIESETLKWRTVIERADIRSD